jgi:predicted dehydrogenase
MPRLRRLTGPNRPTAREPLSIGIVGYGYWGPNLARAFDGLAGVRVAAIVDSGRDERLAAANSFPRAKVLSSLGELLSEDEIDAVVVSTPVDLHFSMVRDVLRKGKPVFVEKPLAMSQADSVELARTADEKGITLMVDHTFLYDPAFMFLCDVVESGQLGGVRYVHSERLNFGRLQTRCNVLWSLGPQDVSMTNFMLRNVPEWVSARGFSRTGNGIADVVHMLLRYASPPCDVAIHLSWLDPRKVRCTTVIGSSGMAVFDDTSITKLTIHNKRVDGGPNGPTLIDGGMEVPATTALEPLRAAAAEFADCCFTGRQPLTNGWNGAEVVAVLEAADRSLEAGGAVTPVNWEQGPMPTRLKQD